LKKIVVSVLMLMVLMGACGALADHDMYFKHAQQVYSFTEDGLARFLALNGMYGYINTKGEVVIPPMYDTAEDFSNGLATVRDGYRNEYSQNTFTIDTAGKIVYGSDKRTAIPTDQLNAEMPFAVSNYCLYCPTAASGNVIERYNWYSPDLEGTLAKLQKVENTQWLWRIESKNRYNTRILYDVAGNRYLLLYMDEISTVMADGLIAVENKGVGFYVDEQGVMKIPPVGVHVYDFHDGVARVQDENGYFYIDTKGNAVHSGRYEVATDMVGGFATVKKDGKWYIMNSSGRLIK